MTGQKGQKSHGKAVPRSGSDSGCLCGVAAPLLQFRSGFELVSK
jgi:hypothetical protein